MQACFVEHEDARTFSKAEQAKSIDNFIQRHALDERTLFLLRRRAGRKGFVRLRQRLSDNDVIWMRCGFGLMVMICDL